jgi:DsbC/DsbD-like thiol-disulfide interchange protein
MCRVALALGGVLVVTATLLAQDLDPRLSTPIVLAHARVSYGASAPTVRPGGKLTLDALIAPTPGIHIYAPGAKNYRPVAFTLEPAKGVTAGKTVYPASELLIFAGELVPVFQRPFRLSREITVGRALKPGTSIRLAGKIAYQACDDKLCFEAESAPVSWTVRVK